MRVGAELRGFVLEAWRDRNPALSDLESRKLIAEVKGVRLKTVESILRHADGGAPKPPEAKPAPATPAAPRRKTRRRPKARRTRKTRGRVPIVVPVALKSPITDRESATLLCVAQCLVEGRDDEGSIRLTDRGRHVLDVLQRCAP